MNSMPAAAPASSSDGGARFLGNMREYWRILSRDAAQLVITLGLYRFWVSTDLRRYLWSRTELAGEQLEYTGDPVELMVGFLVILVVLGPLVAIFSLLSWLTGNLKVADLASYAPFAILVPLGLLALYQARRYRVNHTVYRGLRFHQTGSAWSYALRTMSWFLINVATGGLTYPWARRSLESYKMRHTYYGDLQGRFDGSAAELFKRNILLWLAIVPGIVMLLIALRADAQDRDERALAFLIAAGAWIVIVGGAIYPIFRARVLRWRLAGMRFGTLSLTSDLSAWSLYKAYLKFFGVLVLLAIVVGAVAMVVQVKIVPAMPLGQSIVIEFIGVVLLVIGYFVVATVAALAYQGTVRFEVWRAIVDTLTLCDDGQLARARTDVAHAARHAGRIGAALNLGGF